ncbi:MAG: SsrA-binding protein SmpB [Oscillospiraceae bacterium]|nr:SsrA-binding protein SmpB [Ruminococcus sp.]MCD7889344.1 SsrA-binding protein SmpB [Oscillospiraceae bacterium]
MAKSQGERIIAENRQARHEYFVLDTLEAGIELVGTEVKSIRLGGVNLKDSWCEIRDGEIFAVGVHISPYEKGNIYNRDPRRDRRLLIHKSEIRRLYDKVRQEGLTIVPLKLYYSGSRVKMEIGLCKGKKLYDKRDDMARRQTERDIERVLKERNQ